MTGRAASGPERPEAEHGATVRGDRHRGALGGEGPGIGRPPGDGAGHSPHAGRVGQGQVLAGAHGHPGGHFDLAAQVVEKGAVRDVPDPAFGASRAAVTAATCSSLVAWRVRSTVVPAAATSTRSIPTTMAPTELTAWATRATAGPGGGAPSPAR